MKILKRIRAANTISVISILTDNDVDNEYIKTMIFTNEFYYYI